MSEPGDLRCPGCGSRLEASEGALACAGCGRSFRAAGSVLDLRLSAEAPPTDPLPRAELERANAALARGEPFRAALEALLLALDEDTAERAMAILRESRGAWHPLVCARGGRALAIGNALSGTLVALSSGGFDVTVLDRSPQRLAFAAFRAAALTPGRLRAVAGGDAARLPFADGAFDLVLAEEGLPRPPEWGFELSELRRVAGGELALVCDNRLGYKRSSGRHGRFQVPGPLEYAAHALAPLAGERTLGGYRRALAGAGFARPRAFALYPHSGEFAHVVSLDAAQPSLLVGPKERENRLKVAGAKLGLFPLLAPSYALLTAPRGDARPRVERILDALAEAVGEPRPRLEHLVATRGSSTLLQTALAGAGEDREAGRWCVHLPLTPLYRRLVAAHHERIGIVRERFPALPVPEPLWIGELEGIFLACERRLPGLGAPQLTGDARAAARMTADVARQLATLVVEPAAELDEEGFELTFGPRFERMERHAPGPAARERLGALRHEARERLVGLAFPRVLVHGDLRSKHLQVRPGGSVVGYLDWGMSEDAGLPYFDLFHLVVHERKHGAGIRAGEAWRSARTASALRPYERAALEGYAARLELPAAYLRALEAIYPVLLGAATEAAWDYSRPRWLERHFGV